MILGPVYMSKMLMDTSKNSSHFPLILDEEFAHQKITDFCALYNETYPIDIKNVIEKNYFSLSFQTVRT